MCSNTVHHRSSINGNVDPFPLSTFHFLRTCNRLLIPTDLRSYYNFTKNPEPNKLNVDCSNDNTNFKKSELCSSINNLLSSSESSKHNIITSSTQQLPSISSMITTAGSSASSSSSSSSTISRSGGGMSFDYPNTFDTTEYPLGSFNRISDMNYSSIMNRRQRGEKRPIPEEQKDEKYYERRKRNNEAAKKSRDARKLREDRIAFRAAILEQENAILRAQLIALREEMTTMRQIMGTRPAQISVNL